VSSLMAPSVATSRGVGEELGAVVLGSLGGVGVGVAVQPDNRTRGFGSNGGKLNAKPRRAGSRHYYQNPYYKNCTAARDAGAAPILEGQPGYRPALDRDKDGIACDK